MKAISFTAWIATGRISKPPAAIFNRWVRGACLQGFVPCNGMLYLTPHPCICYLNTRLNGYYALAPKARRIEPPQVGSGAIDTIDPADPLALFEGRANSRMWAVNCKDGETLSEYDLEGTPVYDGMAVTDGRVFVAMKTGKVICFASTEKIAAHHR